MRFDNHPAIRSMADVEAIERTPLSEAIDVWTTRDLISASARDFADKPAFYFLTEGNAIEAPITVTYRELGERMIQAANMFHAMGVGAGDTVAYLLPNLPETIYTILGGTVVARVAPVNWMLEPEHIVHILDSIGAKVLVTIGPTPGYEIWDKVRAVLLRLARKPKVLRLRCFNKLISRQRGDALDFERQIDPDETALFLHTGGTTGKPKLARLIHRGITYHCWANAVAKGLSHRDTVFAGGPLYHTGGVILDVFSTYGIGTTSVILSPMGFRNRAVIANYWKIAERYGLTVMNGVPTVLATLVNNAGDGVRHNLRPYMGTGSASLPVEVAKRVEAIFGIRPLSTYGATEFTCLISCPPRDGDPKYGSCGLPYAHSRFRTVILDGDGKYLRDCEADEIGAIVLRGPGVIPGYVDDADNAKLFVEQDWLVSGDLGRIDADGYLWITGRLKDVIIRGGHNIDSRVIEETLAAHPAVALAAAVGKPDAYAGELPVGYVQLKPGATANAEEIKEFAKTHIPERAAAPVDVIILDALPLTSIGKIYKPPLRHDAAQFAFELALGDLASKIVITDDPRTGTRAVVTLRDPKDKERVRDLMGRYSMAFEIKQGGA
jgi:fatty-acyl-CoA synthase